MNIIDMVIILVLLVIIGLACAYIIKAKKNGAKCIGCPMSKQCSSKNQGETECNCGCHFEKK